jgi:uroporphyrinogen decarboxylase
MSESLFIQALKRQHTTRPPLWLMRQAGRYLPEYRALRENHFDFIAFCLNPEAAAAATLQPIQRFGLDAAIIFADILTVPHALGRAVRFDAGHGPVVRRLTDGADIAAMEAKLTQIPQVLAPVGETVARVRHQLDPARAVIGFSGAPWTLACYLFDIRPSQGVPLTLAFARDRPAAFGQLIGLLTEAVAAYLALQVKAGADAVQLFDSWAGHCPPELWSLAVRQPLLALAARVPGPVLLFPRGAGQADLLALARGLTQKTNGPGALSLDTGVDLAWAAQTLQPLVAIQGNLDPQLLTSDDPAPLRTAAGGALRLAARQPGYIVNLGHGLTPETRIERVAELVRLVQEWK